MTAKVKEKSQLFQWDTNQELVVTDGARFVDFQYPEEIVRIEVFDGLCKIPDVWLQTPGVKALWVCMADNTRIAMSLTITARPMPPDYTSTPEQRVTFDSLVEIVDDLVEDINARADRGEFTGPQGPVGPVGPVGPKGENYTITEADYQTIGAIVEEQLTPQLDALQANKADKTEVAALAAEVDTKADKTALDETNRDVEFLKLVTKDVNWTKEEREENGHAILPKGGLFGNVDEVRGLTTQDGEPTPDNPVEIVSVDEIHILKSHKPYIGIVERCNIDGSGVLYNDTSYYMVIVPITEGTPIYGVGGFFTEYPYVGMTEMRGTRAIGNDVAPKGARYLVVRGSYIQNTTNITIDGKPLILDTNPSVDVEQRTIIPPRPLNAIGNGDYKDKLNVVSGEWEYNVGKFVFDNSYYISLGIHANGQRYASINDSVQSEPGGQVAGMCNEYRFTQWTNANGCVYCPDGTGLIVTDNKFTSVDIVRSALVDMIAYYAPYTEASTIPISPADLDYLRNLTLNKGENLFITDNHGRDVSYLMSDFINLKEALT